MKRFFIIAFLLKSFCVFAGTSWYVSPTGVDANGKGTLANPFKTITYAVNSLSAGDTLFVMGGIYKNADFDANNIWGQTSTVKINNLTGTSSKYIYIKPYQNQTATIQGDGPILFSLKNSSYVQIEGLTIEGELNNIPLDSAKKYQFAYRDASQNVLYRVPPGTSDAVIATMTFPMLSYAERPARFTGQGLVVNSCDHINIYNCIIKNTPGAGLRLHSSDYINVVGCKVNNSTRRGSIGNPGFVLSYLNSIDNNTGVKIYLARNEVYDNYNEVYSWSENKTFINPIIDEGKGMSVEHCITRTAPQDSWHHGRIRFENNIAYWNGLSGLNTNEGERVDFINNTVYNNIRTGRGQNTGISVNNGVDVVIKNNIAVSINSFGGYSYAIDNSSTGVVMNKNLSQGTVDPSLSSIQQNTINADPLFVNATAFNFALQATSPAINQALIADAPTVDFNNRTRDAQPDLGAIEYAAVVPSTLLYFNGKWESNIVNLDWQTTSEFNLLAYEVQRSLDGQNWKTIATISPRLNTNYVNQYTCQDNNVNASNIYYRIAIVDKDQHFNYSNIIKITKANNFSVSVFPNPCTDILIVTGNNSFALKEVKIFDFNGIDVTSKISKEQIDMQKMKLNISGLVSGIYIIKINETIKLIEKIN